MSASRRTRKPRPGFRLGDIVDATTDDGRAIRGILDSKISVSGDRWSIRLLGPPYHCVMVDMSGVTLVKRAAPVRNTTGWGS